MNVSVDTNILIHLYKSGMRELLLSSFEEIYIYDYLVEKELKDNEINVYNKVKEDINEGLIIHYKNIDLVNKGIKSIFDEYADDYIRLFIDRGEAYAIALAKVIGIVAFVSDDIKQYGPHETLLKEVIEDVIPFSFYELLFLKYIKSEINIEILHEKFEVINQKLEHPMSFKGKITAAVMRFSSRGSERDRKWITKFNQKYEVNFSYKMIQLKEYLKEL